MNDPRFVRRRQRARYLYRDVKHLLQVETPTGNQPANRLAFDEFSDDKLQSFKIAQLINGKNVWVIKGRGGARFLAEALHLVLVESEVFGQELQGDAAA